MNSSSMSEFKFTSCWLPEASLVSVFEMDSEPLAILKSQTERGKKTHSRMHGHTNSRRIYLRHHMGKPTKCEYFLLNSHQMQMQQL